MGEAGFALPGATYVNPRVRRHGDGWEFVVTESAPDSKRRYLTRSTDIAWRPDEVGGRRARRTAVEWAEELGGRETPRREIEHSAATDWEAWDGSDVNRRGWRAH